MSLICLFGSISRNVDEMLMVVFGAGASNDSLGPEETENLLNTRHAWRQPPLARDLFTDHPAFSEAVQKFGCGGLVSVIRRVIKNPDESLEAFLEEIQRDIESYGRYAEDFLALRFYLQKIIWETSLWGNLAHGVTNYAGLMSLIDRHRGQDEFVSLVTFNYDTLLEQALAPYKTEPMKELDAYVQGRYKLFKLHGSVNWGRKISERYANDLSGDELRRTIIGRGRGLPLSNQFVLLSAPDVLTIGHQPLLPAIAVPIEGKTEDSFECPERHLSALRDVLPEVTAVLIVGWRGSEQHFLELWREYSRTKPSTIVISDTSESAQATSYRLQQNEIISHSANWPGGFSGAIGNRELREFLNSVP